MAVLEAVLFDYGDTLFRFRYDERTHAAALAGLLEELGRADVSADALFLEVDHRLGPGLDARGEHGELDYLALVRDALAAVGVVVDEQALLRAVRAEHRGWDANRQLHPDSLRLLAAVRERGLRVGMVSNTFDIPELMHEDLALMGLTDVIDAAVFSSELGVRKPHPAIYLHVLELLGVAPARRPVRGRPRARGRGRPGRAGHAHLPGSLLPKRRRRPAAGRPPHRCSAGAAGRDRRTQVARVDWTRWARSDNRSR